MARIFTDPDVLRMPPDERKLFFTKWLAQIARDPDVAVMADGELTAFFDAIKVGLGESGFTAPEAHSLTNPIQSGIVGRREGAKKLDETVQFAANPLGIGGRNYARQLTESLYQGMFQAGAPFIDLATRAVGGEARATDIGNMQEVIPIGGLIGQIIGTYPAYAGVGKLTGLAPGAGRVASALKSAGTFGAVAAAQEAGATGEVSPKNVLLSSLLGAIEGGIGSPIHRALAVGTAGIAAGQNPAEIGAQVLFSALGGERKFRRPIDAADAERVITQTPTGVTISDGQGATIEIPQITAEGQPNPAVVLAEMVKDRPQQTPPIVGPNLTEPGKLGSLETPAQTRIADGYAAINEQAQSFKDRARALREAGLNTEQAVARAEAEFAPTPDGLAPTKASELADALRRSIAKETLGQAELAIRAGQDPTPIITRAEQTIDSAPLPPRTVEETRRAFRELVREIPNERELMEFKRKSKFSLFKDPANQKAFQEALEDIREGTKEIPLRGSATLENLRSRAAGIGQSISITALEGGTKFNIGGKEYSSLRAAQQGIESIERAMKNPEAIASLSAHELDAVAQSKGLEVVPVEDGKVIIRDQVNGVQVEAASRAEAAAVVAKAPVMEAPDIGPGGPAPPLPSPQQGMQPPFNFQAMVDTSNHPGWIGTVQRWVQVKKDLMAKVEEASGIPIFTEVWKPIEDARRQMLPWLTDRRKELNAIFKNHRYKSTHQAVLEYVTSRDKLSVVKAHNMSTSEIRVAQKFDGWLRKTLGEQYSPQIVDYTLLDLMPNARRGDWGFRSGVDLGTAAAPLGTLTDAILSGELRLSERHAGEFGSSLVQQLGRLKFMAEPFNKAGEALNKLKPKEFEGDPKAQGWAVAAKRIGMDYLDAVRNRPDAWAESLSAGLRGVFDRVGLGKHIHPDTVDKLANAFQTAYYGGALAFRQYQAFRNLGQGLFPLVKAWDLPLFASSMREALSRETYAKLRSEGLIGESSALVATAGKFGGHYRSLQDAGMYLYRSADDITRAIAHTYGKNLIEKYGQAYLSKNISRAQFERYTGLEYDYEPVKQQIYRYLDNTESPSVTSAARAYGRSMMEDTQWIYSGSQSPQVFTGTRGKLMGQFGVWPANFANAIGKMLWRGSWGSRARVAARYGALAAGLYGAEALTGYETGDMLGQNPLTWEGGPAWQVINNLKTMASSRNPRDRSIAYTKLKRMVWYFIPGGGLLKDIEESSQEEGIDAMLTALGATKVRKQ